MTNESIKLIIERNLKEKHKDWKNEFSNIISSLCFSSPNQLKSTVAIGKEKLRCPIIMTHLLQSVVMEMSLLGQF